MEKQQKIERKRRTEARLLKQGHNHLVSNRRDKRPIKFGYSKT